MLVCLQFLLFLCRNIDSTVLTRYVNGEVHARYFWDWLMLASLLLARTSTSRLAIISDLAVNIKADHIKLWHFGIWVNLREFFWWWILHTVAETKMNPFTSALLGLIVKTSDSQRVLQGSLRWYPKLSLNIVALATFLHQFCHCLWDPKDNQPSVICDWLGNRIGGERTLCSWTHVCGK